MPRGVIVSFVFVSVLFISSCKSVKRTFVNPDLMNGSTQALYATDEEGREQKERYYQIQRRGVDFFAWGKEPYWLVEIDFDNHIKLTTLSGIDTIIVPVTDSIDEEGLPIVSYKGSSQQGEILVSIEQKECVNDSSGITKHYVVLVSAKRPNDENYTEFKGCGEYFGRVKLHNVWSLKSINGTLVDALKNNRPYMELHLNNGNVMGSLGCNSFSTEFFFGKNQIYFKHIRRTKMACAILDLETQFFKALSNSVLNYRFEGLNLILENKKDTLIFTKVD